jgi:D-glycero-D-manno-heptose 1,7-bisphosphate phosphatase
MTREAPIATAARPAIFADRDGTIVIEKHYLADPALVELVPGAAAALKAFADAGYAVIIVTNQSGIGRGLYSEWDFLRVQERVEQLLESEGVRVDGVYHCPHFPGRDGPCECRKPGTLLYRQAAQAHAIDLARSIYVGDRRKDVEPAAALGGRGILVMTGYGREEAAGSGFETAEDLVEVAARVLQLDTPGGSK